MLRGCMGSARAIVVGAGVSGLSSAIGLLERGIAVEVWTRELPARTTSSVAGAIWYPYKVAPRERVADWARATFAALLPLASDPSSGVSLCRGVELLPRGLPDEAADFRAAASDVRARHPEFLPDGFDRGFELSVPVVEMPIYLEWLLARLRSLGGEFVVRALDSLAPALDAAPLVVNCSGLGARELVGDRELRAIRGQLVRVERGAVERFTLDDYDPRGVTYVIPRSKDCILGGSADDGREDLIPSEATTRAILERCAALEPRLAAARVLSVSVGLRPARSAVRLERETPRPGSTLIHNYGHGGAGVTLSWGCAHEVAALATLV
ncbi:MAG: FAD-dependent oxidoreductase [Planctomycetes bacterium]|nr:FAD-dependent oxidoreductase [Planctomycetota bacterium]